MNTQQVETPYRTITLSNGMETIVDSDDFDELSKYRWSAIYSESSRSFYVVRSIYLGGGRTTTLRMARVILNLLPGDTNQADHRNHDTLDNRHENLRVSTPSQNCMNRKQRSTSLSPFKGVSFDGRRWRAQIWAEGTNKFLGRFADPVKAGLRFDQAARALQGEFALLNFPEVTDYASQMVAA